MRQPLKLKPHRLLCRRIRRALAIIWPDNCPVCGTPLRNHEEVVCLDCLMNIDRIDKDEIQPYLGVPGNSVTIRSWFNYNRQHPSHILIHNIKYRGGIYLARRLGREFAMQKLLDDRPIDIIIPIPLHWTRYVRRSYNQTREVARGINDMTGIPVKSNLRAVFPHSSQTQVGYEERTANVSGVFNVKNPHELDGLHIALLDDIITTGSTMMSALKAILDVARPASVTFLSLGRARS